MITGYATPKGTKKFAERQPEASQQNYKDVNNLTLSNVGIGTYLGNPDIETDKLVENAVKKISSWWDQCYRYCYQLPCAKSGTFCRKMRYHN